MTQTPSRASIVRRFASRRRVPRHPTLLRATTLDRGDHDLNPGLAPMRPLKPAAVLVPLVDRADGFTVLFTRRTAHLAHHAGQISFPGGHIEADDGSAETTALRETEEEVGLHRSSVAVIGHLDTYITRTGFVIVPVVAVIDPPFDLAPDPHEVAEVFEVPLAFLLDPDNHHRCSAEFEGQTRHFYAMPFGQYFIWGATAGMLVNLCQILSEP